jgi:hypothetical protein
MLVLPTLISRYKRRQSGKQRTISIVSKRYINRAKSHKTNGNTQPGHMLRNEMDTHADTCCAGVNWSLLETTGEFCEVSPNLGTYQQVSEIPLAYCCTVWTDQLDSSEHLLVADQMLWFGTQLPNSLINPNQLRAYGLHVNDDPFDHSRKFGIDSENLFIPFDTMGTAVHFNTRVPTEWEKSNLPVVLLTGEDWNPLEEVLRPILLTREEKEMRTIKSLITRQVNSANMKSEVNIHGETDMSLGKISRVYDEQEFRDGLIGSAHCNIIP